MVPFCSALVGNFHSALDTMDRKLIDRKPSAQAQSEIQGSARPNLFQMLEECDRLLDQVSGRDHVAIRVLVQLGLRPEELAALRRNDARDGELFIDEAMIDGKVEQTKTPASAAKMYVPPDLWRELQHYLETLDDSTEAWMFPSARKDVPMRPANFLRRVLKPAAIRAGIALRTDAKGDVTTALNFQTLRRTSSTWFGDKAKDPKSIQAHMRHTDPLMSLRVYQQEIPTTVKAASLAFEQDLLELKRKREADLAANGNARLV